MSTKKNIAVVGCGYWGKNLVRNFYDLGALRAICDSSQNNLGQFKEKCPGVQLESDYQKSCPIRR